MRLGGWQRLWLVLTIAWTLWVAVVTWQTWPPDEWKPPAYAWPADESYPEDATVRQLRSDLRSAAIDKRVHARRVAAARTALILWVLPPLGLYATSRASRWVYHGFRPS